MSKSNQPAFPVALEGAFINSENNLKPFAGMSLRDYFAAAALQGMLQDGFQPNMVGATGNTCAYDYTVAAYAIADRMLKAREK